MPIHLYIHSLTSTNTEMNSKNNTLRKLPLLFVFIAIPILMTAQKKIGTKIFLYGLVEGQLSGNILIFFPGADPSTEFSVVDIFRKRGHQAFSYNSLFLPGTTYSETEFYNVLNDNNITAMISIAITDVAYGGYNYTNTTASGSAYWTSNSATAQVKSSSQAGTVMYTKSVSLNLHIYSSKNMFVKPIAVVAGEATGSGGVASTAKSITKKIMGRIIAGLENEYAF